MSTRLYRSYFTYNGKKYEKTSTKSQRDADKKADQLRRDLEDGKVGISKQMRVSAWAYEWLEVYKKPSVGDKHYKNYKRFVDNVIIPQIGGLRLSDVTAVHLQKILNGRAGNSRSDIKRLRDTMKAIFGKAKEMRLVAHNPSEYLIMPAAKDGSHRSITDFERKHFLIAAEAHHAGLMFKTMLYCGLRTGEVVALSWKDIDFDNHVINVVAAMESGKDTLKETKTAAGVRKVPIPDVIYFDLLERRGDPFEPVFTQKASKKRHTQGTRVSTWNSFKSAIDESMGAKWEKRKAKDGKMRMTKVLSVVANDLVPYCLRHTYCTDLQAKGATLKMASYLMGHANISVTANIYTHITDDAISDVAALLGVTCVVTKGEQVEITA